jgi:hypothetical protein
MQWEDAGLDGRGAAVIKSDHCKIYLKVMPRKGARECHFTCREVSTK